MVAAPASPHGRAAPDAAVALRWHPGITYWLIARHGPSPIAAPASAPIRCDRPGRLIHAIREAVINLRREQLRTDTRLHPDDLDRLRGLLLARIQGGRACRRTLSVWADSVLTRHLDHLDSARCRLLELVTDATRLHPADRKVARAGALAARQITSAFDFDHMIRIVRSDLLQLTRDAAAASLAASAPLGDPDAFLLQAADEFIDKRYTQPVSLADVAKHVGCTPEHLARRYRARRDQTVVQALHERRLGEAARLLLAHPRRPIPAIAAAAGFRTATQFHRLFTRHLKTTPATYRRQS